MSNMFGSLYGAADSLRMNQVAISVINNNIANMNTEGYSKQRVDFEQGSIAPGSMLEKVSVPIGGVEINSISRASSRFLENYYRQENGNLGYCEQMSTSLTFIEEYFNELGGKGITGAMNEFFAAAQEMANDPTNQVARANFVQQAEKVALEFNSSYNSLTDYRESLVGNGVSTADMQSSEVYAVVQDINRCLSEVASLNNEIAIFSAQDNIMPNTLLDERQLILNKLSEYIPLTVKEEGSSVELYCNGRKLVEGNEQICTFEAQVGDADNPVKIDVMDGTFTIINDFQATVTTDSGRLKALLNLGGDKPDSIKGFMDDLNLLAKEFARTINDIQLNQVGVSPAVTEATMCIDNTTKQLKYSTEYIFLDDQATTTATLNPDDITAFNIQVNKNIMDDPFEVSTAYVDIDAVAAQPPPVAIDPDAVGTNNNALLLANSRANSLVNLGGFNVEDKMAAIVSKAGNLTSIANSNLDTQEVIVDQINGKIQSEIGVNLDEELMDLVKFQNSYNASARVFSVVSDMIQLVMNLLK